MNDSSKTDAAPSDDPTESVVVAVEHPVSAVAAVIRRGTGAIRDGLLLFYESENLTFASSIAFYTLLSIFPFLLLVASVIGQFASTDGAINPGLLKAVANILPGRFDFLAGQLDELAAAPIELGVAGTLLTLWACFGVFGAVTSAVNHAWGVETNYGFWQHKLVAFVMMLAAGLLAVTALVLVGAVHVAEAQWFAGALEQYPGLGRLSGVAFRNLPTVLFIVVVGLIYYFIPNTRIRLRDVWFGAALAGVLWRLAFSGFAWYVRDLSRLSVHGSLAAVVGFLLWIYLSAVILLFGVEVTVAWTRLHGTGYAGRR